MQLELWSDGVRYSASAVASEFEIITVTPHRSGITELRLELPVIDIQGYWIPSNRTSTARIPWVIEFTSAAQRDFPFIAFFNSAQENRYSIGLDCLPDDVRIIAKMNQEACRYELNITVTSPPGARPFKVIVNRRRRLWTECLADWRNELPRPELNFPPAAWEPVFCTWYAVHAAVTAGWVEETAKEAAELGFGTYIIDDGWCFDELKRVTPETLRDWYEMIGDWEVSEKKFPDFTGHIRKVQAFGLNYMIWVTPFLIGLKSKLYQEIKSCLSGECAEGRRVFDTAHVETGRIIIEKIASLMETYPLDGLKVDFLDYVMPSVDEPRGRLTHDFIRELSAAIRKSKADALIEFRQSYATPAMLPYGTQFRAGDVPFDFIDNFQRLAQIRISIGDGVPIHADPMYWHPRETAANISRHLIASLPGVPMLSMDLTRLSVSEKLIIAHWLDFYRCHRATLNLGKWEIRYGAAGVNWAAVTGEQERIVILAEPHCLAEALGNSAGTRYLLNLTAEPLSHPNAKAFDHSGETVNGAAPSGGYLQL
jgi:alpha-galactosidase